MYVSDTANQRIQRFDLIWNNEVEILNYILNVSYMY
jgi:hypothetical protein